MSQYNMFPSLNVSGYLYYNIVSKHFFYDINVNKKSMNTREKIIYIYGHILYIIIYNCVQNMSIIIYNCI